MAEDESNFLSRWSRRKRDPRPEPEGKDVASPIGSPVASPAARPAPGAAAEGAADTEEIDEELVAKLPDIDSLEEASDFKPFLAKGVPEVLRRRALRKLWRLNPVFANLDGLNDYDEDFTISATLVGGVKTIYKVGKGMLSDDDKPAAPEVQETQETQDAQIAAADDQGASPEAGREREDEAAGPQPSGQAEGPAEDQADAPEEETARLARGPEEPAMSTEAALGCQDGTAAEPVAVPASPGGRGGNRESAAGPARSAAARRWGETRG